MKLRFRERPVVPIFVIGLLLIFVGIPASFQLANLPFIKGTEYKAEFAEAGGLSTFDAVRVAGVVVGTVEEIKLDGDKVIVGFTAKGVDMGEETTAKISTDTLLGERGLTLEPKGPGKMEGGDTIPLSRTKAPYNVADRIEQSTIAVQQIDKQQLEAAMNTFAETFEPLPEETRATFESVSRLSQTVSSRDEELRNLLAASENVSKVFEERTAQFQSLLIDGNALFSALEQRRADYQKLIQAIEYAAGSVRNTVEKVPGVSIAANRLRDLLDIVKRNEANINLAVQRVSTFLAGIGEGVAFGPWFQGTLYTPLPMVPVTEMLQQSLGGGADPMNGLNNLPVPGIPGIDMSRLLALGGN